MSWPPLPVDEALPALQAALTERPCAVLQAPPGAGKTTRVPLALLDAPWLAGRKILMLEPRRLAATNAARYMAKLLDEPVGQRIGYAIRYARQVSTATRIEVVTEGILTRRVQADPELSGVGLVIFDEFHERNLNSDLALALCRDVQLGLREDLRILVMSATLDAEPVSRLLGEAPLVTSAGRTHPVTIRYLEQDLPGRPEETVAAAVRRALRESSGDLLVFLPGAGEIRRCAELLADVAREVELHQLYGNLPFAAQERAILPGARRKLVLATNIAETSLTIEGVAVVIDSGLERRPRFDAARGMTTLELTRISRASADQRAGRAGRLGPGVCYRLWTEGLHGSLLPFTPPEIRNADLAPLALDLARWGVSDATELSWLDPPPTGHLAGARALLRLLGALDAQDRITPRGETMATFPAHPRLTRLLIAACERGCPELGASLAALLAERDTLPIDAHPRHAGDSDLLERLPLLRRPENAVTAKAARYFQRLLGIGRDSDQSAADSATIGRLLAVAFPDRIGREREPGSGRYLLSNGQGARLSPRSVVKGGEWLVAVDLAGQSGAEGEIRLANRLTREQIEKDFGQDLDWQREVAWEDRAERINAREVRRIGALVWRERPVKATAEETTRALLEVVHRRGLTLFDWSSPALRQWRARVMLLAKVQPEGEWPELSDGIGRIAGDLARASSGRDNNPGRAAANRSARRVAKPADLESATGTGPARPGTAGSAERFAHPPRLRGRRRAGAGL